MKTQVTSHTRLAPSVLPGRRGRISVEKPKNARQVLVRLWHYLSKQTALLVLIAALLIINIGATLSGSYLLRPIINRYIIPHNIAGLIKMILVLLGLYVVGAVGVAVTTAPVVDDRLGSGDHV